jgi:zinc D-Ala-D-Ala dipeptidase
VDALKIPPGSRPGYVIHGKIMFHFGLPRKAGSVSCGMSRLFSAARRLLVTSLLAGCAGSHAAESPSPAAPPVEAPPLPLGSNALAESVLVDVRSADSTIQVDARYATANNFTGAPLPGYDAPRALLRREVAAALGRVQARLRTGDLGLRVFDGYRPVRATMAMVAWAERVGRVALLDSGYIARRSRHNLGVAVDLTLVDLATGTEVPMGTPFDAFTEAAHTANAEGRIRRYRDILVRAMESEGFANYGQEWWHFTYPVDGAVPFDLPIR